MRSGAPAPGRAPGASARRYRFRVVSVRTRCRCHSGRVPGLRDLVVYLAGIALFAGSLTVLWRSMRAVMDIGGYCASGGPYRIAVQCPEGVDVLLFLSIWTGIAGVGIVALFGGRIGPGFAGVAALAWPALFLSLGWNFLEDGVSTPGGPQPAGSSRACCSCSWAACLWASHPSLRGRSGPPRSTLAHGTSLARPSPPGPSEGGSGSAGSRSMADPLRADLAQALRQVASMTAAAASATTVGEATGADDGPGLPTVLGGHSGLVDQLERLARLHEQGALGEQEYLEAQRAVIEASSRGGMA